MSNINRLMELSGLEGQEMLVEYANGGVLDKVLVVVNPTQHAESFDDCIKEVTAKELFMLASQGDVAALNPTLYYPRATGAAKKDAKARFEAIQDANEKRGEAEELTKAAELATAQADEAERAAGIIRTGEPEMGTEVDPVEPVGDGEEPKPEEEEVASEVISVEKVAESVGEDNQSLDTAQKAKYTPHEPKSDGQGVDRPDEQHDDSEKVTVPAEIMSDLNKCIKEFAVKADHYSKMANFANDAAHCLKVVECGEELRHMLEQGNQIDFDKAVIYFSSLMNPIQIDLPTSLSKYLKCGGKTGRSLKDYYINARKG